MVTRRASAPCSTAPACRRARLDSPKQGANATARRSRRSAGTARAGRAARSARTWRGSHRSPDQRRIATIRQSGATFGAFAGVPCRRARRADTGVRVRGLAASRGDRGRSSSSRLSSWHFVVAQASSSGAILKADVGAPGGHAVGRRRAYTGRDDINLRSKNDSHVAHRKSNDVHKNVTSRRSCLQTAHLGRSQKRNTRQSLGANLRRRGDADRAHRIDWPAELFRPLSALRSSDPPPHEKE